MPSQSNRPVVTWLCCVYAMILVMIVLGGVTRLTESGLSIVKWEPFLGVVPPMSDAAWQDRFEQYRNATGQAAAVFPDLTISQFKTLFYWEYFHRLAGRIAGIVVAVPFVFFLVRRRLERGLAIKIVLAFIFGGLQGGVGWVMVATGLQKDMTHVSHYALAAHLALALALMSYLAWLILGLLPPRDARLPRWLRPAALTFLAVLALQIVYGAFTAGIRAGYFYNTFPAMNGMWLPAETFLPDVLSALHSNPVAIQWIHRLLAWLLGAGAIALGIAAWTSVPAGCRARRAVFAVSGLTVFQFGLGVAVLLLGVPVWLGALHQLNAAFLLTAVMVLLHACKRDAVP